MAKEIQSINWISWHTIERWNRQPHKIKKHCEQHTIKSHTHKKNRNALQLHFDAMPFNLFNFHWMFQPRNQPTNQTNKYDAKFIIEFKMNEWMNECTWMCGSLQTKSNTKCILCMIQTLYMEFCLKFSNSISIFYQPILQKQKNCAHVCVSVFCSFFLACLKTTLRTHVLFWYFLFCGPIYVLSSHFQQSTWISRIILTPYKKKTLSAPHFFCVWFHVCMHFDFRWYMPFILTKHKHTHTHVSTVVSLSIKGSLIGPVTCFFLFVFIFLILFEVIKFQSCTCSRARPFTRSRLTNRWHCCVLTF